MSIYTLGIDIGSTASKCVVLKDGQEIVTRIDPDAIPREEWDGTLK